MYGIINKALQDMVIANHGTDIWEAAKEKSEVEVDFFISQEIYEDAITHKLIAAVADLVQLQPQVIYFAMGEWWMVYTLREKYDGLIESGGNNVKEFLLNLPVFFSAIKRLCAASKLANFTVSNVQENSLYLSYFSSTTGLEEIVRGGLNGLGKLYETDLIVSLVQNNNQDETQVTYNISW